MSDDNGNTNIGCGCMDIILIIILVCFVFVYECDTKRFVEGVAVETKEYANIIDSVWKEHKRDTVLNKK